MEHQTITAKVTTIIQTILQQNGIERSEFPANISLYEDGLGLTSLDAATFSVVLEREFGADPYATGQFPQTIDQVVEFLAN